MANMPTKNDLIAQFKLSDIHKSIDLEPGKYRELGFLFMSTGNNSGTVNESSFGNLVVTLDGKTTLANLDFSPLHFMNSLDLGSVRSNLASGAPLSYAAYLPFAYPGDEKNVVETHVKGQLNVKFANMNVTNVGTGDIVQIYGLQNPIGYAAYTLKHHTFAKSVGTGNNIPVQMAGYKNISRMMVEQDTDLSQIYLTVDNEIRYNVCKEWLDILTNTFNRIETDAGQAWFDMQFSDGSLEGALNDDYQFLFNTTGDATINFLIQTYSLNNAVKVEQSYARTANAIKQKVAKKSPATRASLKFQRPSLVD